MAERAIDCFARQEYPRRQLLIVCDGLADLNPLKAYVSNMKCSNVDIHAVPRGTKSLGALRNLSIGLAQSDIVCQWDDDDLYHPERISRQLDCLLDSNATVCFLTEQLHLLSDARRLFWCDWLRPRNRPSWPATIPNTLMAYRAELPAYPEVGYSALRTEDTYMMSAVQSGLPAARLTGCGWVHMYIGHSRNTWASSHHRTIIRTTGRGCNELLPDLDGLSVALGGYPLIGAIAVCDYLDHVVRKCDCTPGSVAVFGKGDVS